MIWECALYNQIGSCMGYTVANMLETRNYVLANGAALFIAYAVRPLSCRLTFFSKQ